MDLKQIYLIHLTIIFILLLVIYGSAQQTQEAEEQPSQTFFYATHSVFLEQNSVKIDGENGTIIETGDLTYPTSKIVDVVELNGTKAVILSHSLNGAVGKTQVKTTVLSQSTMPVDEGGDFDGVNITYIGTAKGTHGTYLIYKVGNKTISVNEPTLIEVNGQSFLLSVNQNTLTISKVMSVDDTLNNALIVEGVLGVVVVGLIVWSRKSSQSLFS